MRINVGNSYGFIHEEHCKGCTPMTTLTDTLFQSSTTLAAAPSDVVEIKHWQLAKQLSSLLENIGSLGVKKTTVKKLFSQQRQLRRALCIGAGSTNEFSPEISFVELAQFVSFLQVKLKSSSSQEMMDQLTPNPAHAEMPDNILQFKRS